MIYVPCSLPLLHWFDLKGAAAGTSDSWLEARQTSTYHTRTHTNTRTHTQNVRILLHKPDPSESTFCYPLGFPPLPPLSAAYLFLSAAASTSTPSFHSSLSFLLNSAHLVLHSSSRGSGLFPYFFLFFFFIRAITKKKQPSNEVKLQSQIFKNEKCTGMIFDLISAIRNIQFDFSSRSTGLYSACNAAYTFIHRAEQK